MIGVLDRRRPQLPLMAMCLAIVVWGSGPLFVRGATVSSPTVAFWRFWMAVPVMWSVAYALGGRFSWVVLRRALPAGLLFGGSTLAGYAAFQSTSIAIATLLPSLTPALVLMVASRMFGDHVGKRLLAMAAAAFAGVAVVVLFAPAGGAASANGTLYAALNLLLWTGYFMYSKHLRDAGLHPWAMIASIFTIAALFMTPYCMIRATDLGGSQLRDWLMYLGLVFGPGLVGHGLMTWAQAGVDISVSSVLTLGNAPLSMLGAWLIFGQSLRPVQLVGVAVVLVSLGSIALTQANRRRRLLPVVEPEPV